MESSSAITVLFNVSSELNSTTPNYPECGDIVVTGFFIVLIMLVAFLGNSLVVGSSVLDPEIRRGGLLPMVTLAVTDLIFAEVSGATILVSLVCPSCAPGGILCTWMGIVELLLVVCVMYQHAFMAVTRYVAVCKAVKYKIWFTTRNVIIILVILLCIAIILAVVPSIFPTIYTASMAHQFDRSLLICIFQPTLTNIVYTSVLYFSTPVAVGTFCYVSCFHKLHQKRSNGSAEKDHVVQNSSSTKQQHRLVLTMLISYCIVLITSVPLPLTIIAFQVTECNLIKRHVCWMILFNSCVNPIVYAIKSSKFRKMFLRQLGCKEPVKKNHVRPESTLM